MKTPSLSSRFRQGFFIFYKVYCDQSLYGGGWTVIQTRASTDESFDRNWQEYKAGFGELERDFWLGNKFIHRLTAGKQELSLELKSSQDDVTFVLYESFQISDQLDGFRLHIAEYVPSPGGKFEWIFTSNYFSHEAIFVLF